MKNTPDIYADNPVVSTEYIIAVMVAALAGKKLQTRSNERGARTWYTINPHDALWNWVASVYRVDPSEKPEPPKIKVPFTQETFPVGMVWLRLISLAPTLRVYILVTSLAPNHVVCADGINLSYGSLSSRYEYSLDRMTWFPCHTEVDAPETAACSPVK